MPHYAPADTFDDVDVPTADLSVLLKDDEVDGKYNALQEKLASAPTDAPAIVDTGETEEEEEERKKQEAEAAEAAKNAAKDGKKRPKSPPKKKKKKQAVAGDGEAGGCSGGILQKKPPIRWKKLLYSRVQLRELRVKSVEHRSTYVAVLYPCKVGYVRTRLCLELKREAKSLRLVYMGALLKDEEVVPEECFTAKRFNFLRWVDDDAVDEYLAAIEAEEARKRKELEDAEAALRQMRLRQTKQATRRAGGWSQAMDDKDILEGLEEEDEEEDDDQFEDGSEAGSVKSAASPKSRPSTAEAAQGSRPGTGERRSPMAAVTETGGRTRQGLGGTRRLRTVKQALDDFDLMRDLQHIKCEQFGRLLLAKGFSDKGAFAYVTEEELMGPGLWINKRAARRILGLADVYKRQLEIETTVSTSDLQQISLSLTQRQKYTIDGVHFFATQQELNAWVEAQKKQRSTQRVREMSVKKDHSAEILDVYESIEARLRLEAEKEAGELTRPTHVDPHFCCAKHAEAFDKQVEEEVDREAVDYDNDFQLLLEEANKVKSTYLPGDIMLEVVTQLFLKHRFPFRQYHLERMMKEASQDDNGMYYDIEVLRKRVVEHLKARKRHLLLDLRG